MCRNSYKELKYYIIFRPSSFLETSVQSFIQRSFIGLAEKPKKYVPKNTLASTTGTAVMCSLCKHLTNFFLLFFTEYKNLYSSVQLLFRHV